MEAAEATMAEQDMIWNKVMVINSAIGRIRAIAKRTVILHILALVAVSAGSVSCSKNEITPADTLSSISMSIMPDFPDGSVYSYSDDGSFFLGVTVTPAKYIDKFGNDGTFIYRADFRKKIADASPENREFSVTGEILSSSVEEGYLTALFSLSEDEMIRMWKTDYEVSFSIRTKDGSGECMTAFVPVSQEARGGAGGDPVELKIGSVTSDPLFPEDRTVSIGVFLIGKGYTADCYKNIECKKMAGGESWSIPQTELPKFEATVYAYYPYKEGITDISQIPVTSSVCGGDWMWAAPVGKVSRTNPTVNLKFRHSLALVQIKFNIYGFADTENLKMTDIKLYGEGFKFSGVLDATCGMLSPDSGDAPSEGSPLTSSEELQLPVSDHSVVADAFLVPVDDSGKLRSITISCNFGGKVRKATIPESDGVIISPNTKSTILLSIKDADSKMEVASVGVDEWDDKVDGNSAEIDGHTVTFNCPEDMKYELCIEAESTAIPGESTQGGNPTVILRYDVSSIPDYRFVFNGAATSCTVSYDWQNGIITVKDVTKDVTVNLGYGTYIKYTASEKVTPNKTDAFGFTYDEDRSTFNKGNGSGVVAIDGILTTIGDDAFYGTSISGIIIPEGVTGIGKSAFDDCLELVSVTFPSTLTSIGNNAFQEMGNESAAAKQPLVLPSSLSSIGQFAFETAKIESVTLPSGLKTVGESAFKTSTLETLVIEDGAVLGKKMFNNCGELKTVTSKSTTPPAAYHDDSGFVFAKVTDVITALANLENIYVPSSSVDTYKSDYGWSIYKNKISAIPSQD